MRILVKNWPLNAPLINLFLKSFLVKAPCTSSKALQIRSKPNMRVCYACLLRHCCLCQGDRGTLVGFPIKNVVQIWLIIILSSFGPPSRRLCGGRGRWVKLDLPLVFSQQMPIFTIIYIPKHIFHHLRFYRVFLQIMTYQTFLQRYNTL